MPRPKLRIVAEVVLFAVVLVAVTAMFTRLVPVAPALAGVARAVLHPLVLALLVAAFLAFRLGRGRRRRG